MQAYRWLSFERLYESAVAKCPPIDSAGNQEQSAGIFGIETRWAAITAAFDKALAFQKVAVLMNTRLLASAKHILRDFRFCYTWAMMNDPPDDIAIDWQLECSSTQRRPPYGAKL